MQVRLGPYKWPIGLFIIFMLEIIGAGLFFIFGGMTVGKTYFIAPGTIEYTQHMTAVCQEKQATEKQAEVLLDKHLQSLSDELNAIGAQFPKYNDIGQTIPLDQLAARGGPDVVAKVHQLDTDYTTTQDEVTALQQKYACQ